MTDCEVDELDSEYESNEDEINEKDLNDGIVEAMNRLCITNETISWALGVTQRGNNPVNFF